MEEGQKLRDTGLKAVGEVPWGSHFCIFYETKKDLLEIVVPFFKAGLQANEFCLWIVANSELLTINEAKAVLHEAVPDFDRLLKNGNIEIVPYSKWFMNGRAVDFHKAIARFRQRVNEAVNRGFSGARITGSPAWMRNNLRGRSFREFEQKFDGQLTREQMIAACTFPLRLSGAEDILDAARTHQFAVTVRKGAWKRVEIADTESAKREARQNTSPKLEQLTFRQREILQLVAKGQNTKQIADLLGISVKTVEAHRLQLMRGLKIDNVPGLVRFAIRTGLVSSES
ncbi:MAG TPA: MEDS domain-containing protein [Candidatus Dormibacteraeota bacterium]|nr:MEDS domain-containing protein [Candidatus Dormibacteraeota bacterium]